MKKSKSFIKTTLFFLIPGLLIASRAVPEAKEIPTLKIGVIYSLTGAASAWGTDGLKALEIAKKEVEDQGRIKIELVIEDSKSEPKNVVTAYQKLVKIHNVDAVIGDVWNYLTDPMIPLSIKDRKIVLSPTYTDLNPPQKSDYFFSLGTKTNLASEAVGSFFKSRPAIKTLSLFNFDGSWGEGYFRLLKQASDRNKIKIKDVFSTSDYSYDFKNEFLKIKNDRPDAVYIAHSHDKLIKEMNLHSFKPVIISSDNINYYLDQKFLTPAELSGLDLNIISWRPSEDFNSKFQAYAGIPDRLGAFCSYEALKSIAMAYQISAGDLQAGMNKVKYNGVAGPIDFTESFSGNWAKAVIVHYTQ